uniref:Uncharacterized protein n=1 Tax=Cannabis sativa TaxID=3483 RepID=A0A803PLV6_CANSA
MARTKQSYRRAPPFDPHIARLATRVLLRDLVIRLSGEASGCLRAKVVRTTCSGDAIGSSLPPPPLGPTPTGHMDRVLPTVDDELRKISDGWLAIGSCCAELADQCCVLEKLADPISTLEELAD